MSGAGVPGDPIRELRSTFDNAFAVALAEKGEAEETLIAIRIGSRPYALWQRQILGVSRVRRLVPVSSRLPQLAGVIGLRGLVVPVFRLSGFVQSREPVTSPRWIALVEDGGTLGLGFDGFDGQCNVPGEQLYRQEEGPEAGAVRQVARIGSVVRPIVEVPLVLQQLRPAAQAPTKGNEES